MPVLPYQLGVSINPLKGLVVIWLNGAPMPLTVDQAVILEGLIRDARASLSDGVADEVAGSGTEGEGQ